MAIQIHILETDEEITPTRELVERARAKRKMLLRQIEESQKTIDRSRELIARIDEVLAQAESQLPKLAG